MACEVDRRLVIAHESPVRVIPLKDIDCLGLAEMKGRRIGACRAKAAPDLIHSYEHCDVLAGDLAGPSQSRGGNPSRPASRAMASVHRARPPWRQEISHRIALLPPLT